VNYDPSGTVGARVGYWIKWLPFIGIAVELPYYKTKADGVQFEITGANLSVLLRMKFSQKPFSQCRFVPYAAFGVNNLILNGSIDFEELPNPIKVTRE
jgi:hypothetical protein